MKVRLAPSILSADISIIKDQLQELEENKVKVLHVDVMDGQFVPNITFGPIMVKALRKMTKMTLDVHLMIADPDKYVRQFFESGADVITVHAEASTHLQRTLTTIRQLGIEAGVALNPHTHESVLEYLYDYLDLILVMSVNPGYGGQKFIPQSLDKIANISKKIASSGRKITLEVDGGVTAANAKEIVDAGANLLVAGSAVFQAKSISKGVTDIMNAIK